MNINLTLVGQMITFTLFVWVTMQYVWPPIMQAMEERRERIAAGEAANEAAKRALSEADSQSKSLLADANAQKDSILADAQLAAKGLIEEAKSEAKVAAERLAEQAKAKREQQAKSLSDGVRAEWSHLVVEAAQSLLKQEMDAKRSEQLVNDWLAEHE